MHPKDVPKGRRQKAQVPSHRQQCPLSSVVEETLGHDLKSALKWTRVSVSQLWTNNNEIFLTDPFLWAALLPLQSPLSGQIQ